MSTVVYVGSARIDERGQAYGGTPGDQTGGEVAIQRWYRHKLGWRVFRPVSAAAGRSIALCMRMACANTHIGYNQWRRDSLYTAAAPLGFDCGRVQTDVETDCSALVRVCLAFAGIQTPNFRTYNEPSVLLASGQFVELKGTLYTDAPDRLRAGDVLVTPTSGHTVVVLNDGNRADAGDVAEGGEDEMDLVKRGSRGSQVKTLQRLLNAVMGANLAVDGDFGSATDAAVRAYQEHRGLQIDGQCGRLTWEQLLKKE